MYICLHLQLQQLMIVSHGCCIFWRRGAGRGIRSARWIGGRRWKRRGKGIRWTVAVRKKGKKNKRAREKGREKVIDKVMLKPTGIDRFIVRVPILSSALVLCTDAWGPGVLIGGASHPGPPKNIRDRAKDAYVTAEKTILSVGMTCCSGHGQQWKSVQRGRCL